MVIVCGFVVLFLVVVFVILLAVVGWVLQRHFLLELEHANFVAQKRAELLIRAQSMGSARLGGER